MLSHNLKNPGLNQVMSDLHFNSHLDQLLAGEMNVWKVRLVLLSLFFVKHCYLSQFFV